MAYKQNNVLIWAIIGAGVAVAFLKKSPAVPANTGNTGNTTTGGNSTTGGNTNTNTGGTGTVNNSDGNNIPSFWTAAFYKNAPGNVTILTSSAAADYADQIYDAMGSFGDSFNTVLGVFTQLRTKAQISYLADVFAQRWQGSLYGWLKYGTDNFWWNGLSDSQWSTLNSIIQTLPNYTA